MSEQKNISWINYVRAICMIMIFLVHSATYYGLSMPYVSTLLHPVYVNAFFIVSGYLLFRIQLMSPVVNEDKSAYLHSEGKKYIINIFFKLVIPSIIFSILEFFPSYLLRGRTITVADLLLKTIGGGTYWFTSALVIAQLLLFILLAIRCKNVLIYFLGSLGFFSIGQIAIVYQFNLINDSFPWEWKLGLLSTIFLSIGGLYWKYEKRISAIFSKKVVILIASFVYIALLLVFPSNFKVLISMQDINLLGVVISTLGTILLIELCKSMKDSMILNYIGKNTITMYFLSGALPIVFSLIVSKIMPVDNYIGLLIVFICSFGMALLATWVIGKYIPFILDFRKIGKHNQ